MGESPLQEVAQTLIGFGLCLAVLALFIVVAWCLHEFFVTGPRERAERYAAEPIHHREWPITSTSIEQRGPRRSNGRPS